MAAGGITVDPAGQTVSVTITGQAFFSDAALLFGVAFPTTITALTTFYSPASGVVDVALVAAGAQVGGGVVRLTPGSFTTMTASAGGSSPDVPSYATTTHRFDPATGLYNVTPATTRRFRTAAGKARAGVKNLTITCPGDSTTFGQGATPADGTRPWVTSWVNRLRAAIAGDGVLGNGSIYANASLDSRFALTNWSQFGTVGIVTSSTVGGTATFTADALSTGTAIDIYTLKGPTGTFSYAIDGGAANNVVVPTGTNGVLKTTITGLSAGTHNVVITLVSGSVYLMGLVVYTPTSGFTLNPLGLSGYTVTLGTSKFYGTTYTDPSFDMAAMSPDLAIVMLGTNDAATAGSVSTFQTALASLVAQQQAAGGDVLLVAQQPRNDVAAATHTPFIAAMYAVADSAGCPLIDLYDRWGSYAAGNALGLYADAVHPTNTGYGDVAAALHAFFRLAAGF